MQQTGKNELSDMALSPDEILISIWNDLLPHRTTIIEDGKIDVTTDNGETYQGREMSDGEQVTPVNKKMRSQF
jgi:hypothetical protein